MRTCFFIFTFLCMQFWLCAQSSQFCASNEVLEQTLASDPAQRKQFEKAQQELNKYSEASHKPAAAVYTIPVVFHVLHLNGPENISDAQIYDAMQILNKHYRKQNADTIAVLPPFVPADSQIEFRLATRDPNGNCTSGITRHYDTKTNWVLPITGLQYQYTWPTNSYLNIYLVKSITNFFYGGYSSFPGNPGVSDVIVVTSDCIGSFGTSNLVKSRILTHEIGHFFNLRHIWGNTSWNTVCGDDLVNDTPITKGNGGCPVANPSICATSVAENFQNHMDYCLCPCMFTAGQAARMAACLNSTVSGRNNLSLPANLLATGIINPLTNCVPIAYIAAPVFTVCQGKYLQFIDASYNGTVSTRLWSSTGTTTISALNNATTNILFANPGLYTVTLLAGNSSGSTTDSHTVLVLGAPGSIGTNYSESFEANGLPPFFVLNNEGGVDWLQHTAAAASGSNSYYVDGSFCLPANLSLMETPCFDFLNNPGATLTFKYAYAKSSPTCTDVFKVQAKEYCDVQWKDIFVPPTSYLANGSGGVSSVPFVPASAQFINYTLSAHPAFTSFLSKANVQLRFYFKEDSLNGGGNNIFIDDINFSAPYTALKSQMLATGFEIQPNPSAGNFYLVYKLNAPVTSHYCVYDINGRKLFSGIAEKMEPGIHMVLAQTPEQLPSGMYFINLYLDQQVICKKMILER